MQRDSKLGYGFLLVGTGLPFLIDKVLGLTAAIIVSVVCVVSGVSFLFAGHRHKEGEVRPRRKTWELVVIAASLGTLIVLLSIGILRVMPKKESSKSGESQPRPQESRHEESKTESSKIENPPAAKKKASAILRHEETPAPPLIRRKAFSTVIPFALDNFHAGIPYDSNTKDPLLLTYTVLAGVSEISTSPIFDQSSGKLVAPTVSDADMANFLGHLMQYYILRTVNEIENPVTYTNFETGKGLSTEMYPPVSVPDEKEYPNDKLFKLFEKLKLRFNINSGPNDWIWKEYKMKVPSGTSVDFVEIADIGKTNYIIRFEREPDLLLDFRIEPAGRNRGQGTFPKNFVPLMPREIQDAYSYVFTVYVDLHWKGDRTIGQDYVEWANGLEAGLHKKLVLP